MTGEVTENEKRFFYQVSLLLDKMVNPEETKRAAQSSLDYFLSLASNGVNGTILENAMRELRENLQAYDQRDPIYKRLKSRYRATLKRYGIYDPILKLGNTFTAHS